MGLSLVVGACCWHTCPYYVWCLARHAAFQASGPTRIVESLEYKTIILYEVVILISVVIALDSIALLFIVQNYNPTESSTTLILRVLSILQHERLWPFQQNECCAVCRISRRPVILGGSSIPCAPITGLIKTLFVNLTCRVYKSCPW